MDRINARVSAPEANIGSIGPAEFFDAGRPLINLPDGLFLGGAEWPADRRVQLLIATIGDDTIGLIEPSLLRAGEVNPPTILGFDEVVVHETSPWDMSDWAQGFNVPTADWFQENRLSKRGIDQ